MVRGEAHEPVAVEIELRWVISGPLTYSQSAHNGQVVQVNFVGSDRVSPDSLDRNVQRLWDLETLGVTACDGVYEEFMESIFFNRARYSVKLPWKELSLLEGLFDPLGVISPMIVPMKILFQTLCCEKRDWDDELEGESKGKLNNGLGIFQK